MPRSVLRRAGQILKELQRQSGSQGSQMTLFGWDDVAASDAAPGDTEPEPAGGAPEHGNFQGSDGEGIAIGRRLRQALSEVNPDRLTPLEALKVLYELKGMVNQ